MALAIQLVAFHAAQSVLFMDVASTVATGPIPECSAAAGKARKQTIWELSRNPERLQYCRHISRALTLLRGTPEEALSAIELAETAWPRRAATENLRGRALMQLGKFKEAGGAFDAALQLDPGALPNPATLHEHAQAFVRTGNPSKAAATYRKLVPRLSGLDPLGRELALVEAAFAIMAAIDGSNAGEEGKLASEVSLLEAVSLLQEASELNGERGPAILYALALAHDRLGAKSRVDALLFEAARAKLQVPNDISSLVTDPLDVLALNAFALEAASAPGTLEAWRNYARQAKNARFVDVATKRSTLAPGSSAGPPRANKPVAANPTAKKPGTKKKPKP